MTRLQCGVLVQNIGRSLMGTTRGGGSIAPVRLSVHNNKPSILILTEICESENLTGKKGVFKGLTCTQHSFAGPESRTGGVAIFVRPNSLAGIEGSTRNSPEGHYTAGIYLLGQTKVIVGGVYGPSCSSDNKAFDVFQEFFEILEELMQRWGTQNIILGGDFNLKLDQNETKPRAVKLVRDFINEYAILDAGLQAGCQPTWRRPNAHRRKSRLDYILYTENLIVENFKLTWFRKDHAQLTCALSVGGGGRNPLIKPILKDWVLTRQEFLEKAPDVILDVLLDHDLTYRNSTLEERADFVDGRKPQQMELELNVCEAKEGIFEAHVFQIILQKIVKMQKTLQMQIIREQKEILEQINSDIAGAFEHLDSLQANDPEIEEVEAYIAERKYELTCYAENKELAGRQRILNFEQTNNGKGTAASFYVTRELKSKKTIQKLVNDNGQEITESQEIVEKLEDNYKSAVGSAFVPNMRLVDFLERYGVEMPKLAEEEQQSLNEDVTKEEIQLALSSAKVRSSPGPSGQSISIFKYLFSQIPKLMTAAINQLIFVPGLMHGSSFAWLIERRVVYIPKPGKPADRVGNLRPLSLLETLYKILTRVLTRRMAGTLDAVLYSEQHGFRGERSTQTAVLPVLEAIQDAERTGQPLQLLAVDLKAAFDTIAPDVIYQVMQLECYPAIYADALHKITSSGTGRIFVNKILGEKFYIKGGTGQGDPASAPRFTVGSDPVLRALNIITEEFRYKFSNSNTKLPVLGYADDHFKGLAVSNPMQIVQILQVYEDFSKVSGLKISIEKTSILAYNTCPELLNSITEQTGIRVVTSMRYLGVEIRQTFSESREASYLSMNEKLTGKHDRISSSFVDLFHKRQLIQTVMLPSYNHIVMAFGYSEQVGTTVDSSIRNLLWEKTRGGVVSQGRRLVAKNRLAASFNMGGLQMDLSAERAQGLLLNTLQRFKNQMELPEEKRIIYAKIFREKLEEIDAPSLKDLFQYCGSQIWLKYSNRLKNKSIILSQMFSSYANFLQLNEKSKESWLTVPIAGHSKIPPIYRLTVADGYTLAQQGYTHIAQLFAENYFTGGMQWNEDAEYTGLRGANVEHIIVKCKMLRRELTQSLPSRAPRPIGSLEQTLQGKKLSSVFRESARRELDGSIPGPPAYFTRRRDGISIPPLHRFMQGYDNLFKMKLSSKTLETSFSILNRVVWTNQKQNWTTAARGDGDAADPSCLLCGRTENTLHLIFECERLAEPLWAVLTETVNRYLDERGVPHRITLHSFNVMYNMYVAGMEASGGGQLQLLIQEIKRMLIYKRYSRSTTGNTGRAIAYDLPRIIMNIMIVTKKLISLRKFQGKDREFLEGICALLMQRMDD